MLLIPRIRHVQATGERENAHLLIKPQAVIFFVLIGRVGETYLGLNPIPYSAFWFCQHGVVRYSFDLGPKSL